MSNDKQSSNLDLKKLKNKLDLALSNETSESLNGWLDKKRMSGDKQSSLEMFAKTLAEQGLLVTRDYENLVAYRQAKEMRKEEMIKLIQYIISNEELSGYGSISPETANYYLDKFNDEQQ